MPGKDTQQGLSPALVDLRVCMYVCVHVCVLKSSDRKSVV